MTHKIKGGKLVKPQVRSVFHDCESVECVPRDPSKPAAPPHTPKVQVEMVGIDPENPTEIYLVVDGERAAYRGRAGGMPAWIPMRNDVHFHNGIPVPGTDTVQ